MRKTLTWLTVLTLVLTGHAMAVAHGMPGSSGYAELCIGQEPVMVAVDAEGNPTGESNICPEFGLSLLNLVAPPATALPVPDAKAQKAVILEELASPVVRIIKGSARAPPMAA